jgi:sialic acid synthase SpsE
MEEVESDGTFVIAEAGINHGGDSSVAKQLVREAADSGADAVKFQLWDAEEFHSERNQIKRLKELELSYETWRKLREIANEEEILFFASVFSHDSIDFLVDELDVPLIKVASGEITNIPLLEQISQKNVPVILSTGMATLGEVERAFEVLKNGPAQVSLLECVSSYPVEMTDLNLSVIKTLKRAFNCPVGFSDHSTGTVAPLTAVALGADIVEKHFTLSKELEGPDQKLSLTPDEFETMVEQIRKVEYSIGNGIKRPREPELDSRISMRRGLKARTEIEHGQPLSEENVKVARPSNGIEPTSLETVLGLRVQTSLSENDPITWDDLTQRDRDTSS